MFTALSSANPYKHGNTTPSLPKDFLNCFPEDNLWEDIMVEASAISSPLLCPQQSLQAWKYYILSKNFSAFLNYFLEDYLWESVIFCDIPQAGKLEGTQNNGTNGMSWAYCVLVTPNSTVVATIESPVPLKQMWKSGQFVVLAKCDTKSNKQGNLRSFMEPVINSTYWISQAWYHHHVPCQAV